MDNGRHLYEPSPIIKYFYLANNTSAATFRLTTRLLFNRMIVQRLIQFLLCLSLLCLPFVGTSQQSAFEVEYLKKLGVKKRTGFSTNYKDGKAVPDCVKTIESYNPDGKLVQFTDYRKCGEVYTVFNYQYTTTGKLLSGDIQFLTVSSKPLPFTFRYDEKGRVTNKICEKPERGFYQNEHLSYDNKGNITRVDYLDQNGILIKGSVSIVHEFENGRLSGFNFTLAQAQADSRAEFKYAPNGSLKETRYYQGGQLTQTITYTYEYF